MRGAQLVGVWAGYQFGIASRGLDRHNEPMQPSELSGAGILIVEDDALLRRQIAAYLERQGLDVTVAGTLAEARRFLEQLSYDFALIDVNLPDGQGTDLLRDKAVASGTGAIIMTAEGRVQGAVEAMRLGALDYLAKPFDFEQVPLAIQRARRTRQAMRLAEHQREGEARQEFVFGVALSNVQTQLDRILAADHRVQSGLAPVLIVGETGTGKTSIARWLHHHGPRAEQPLVEVNCSALPDTLAESELFGHERGAFTDARTMRLGLFEAARGGTLFLDEVPSLSLPLQAKVLTAIEDRRIRRLGGNKSIAVDVRIIAASNCDLKELAAAGRFREDLFHRLDLFRIHLPPLRDRGEDILETADLFLERLCRRHRVRLKGLSEAGRRRLLAHPWPGNVRELAHEIERAIVFEEGELLDFPHLGPAPLPPAVESGGQGSDAWFNERFVFPEQGFSLEQATDRLVQHALAQAGGNVSAAARLLGVSRDVVRYRLSSRRGTGGAG